MRTRAHLSPDILNVCVYGGVHGVITGNKLHAGTENWGLPLTWLIALTTTVQHYRAANGGKIKPSLTSI